MYWNPPQNANNPTNPFWHPLNEKTKSISEAVTVELDFKNDAEGKKAGGKMVRKGVYKMTFKNNAEMNKFMDTHADKLNENTEELEEGTPEYRAMMKKYKGSDMEKVFKILDKEGFRMGEQSDTLVRNMLKKHRGNVKKAADQIMKDNPGMFDVNRMMMDDVQIDEAEVYKRPAKVSALGGQKFHAVVENGKIVAAGMTEKEARKMKKFGQQVRELPGAKVGQLVKEDVEQFDEDINESILDKVDKMMDKAHRKMDRLARRYANYRDSLPRNKAKIDREHKERMEKIRKNFDKMVADLDRAYAHVDEEVKLNESRDDFDYLDVEAARQDARAMKPKVEKTRNGFQVMVFSRKARKHIPQGSPHKTKAAAEKDAKMFEGVEINNIDEYVNLHEESMAQGSQDFDWNSVVELIQYFIEVGNPNQGQLLALDFNRDGVIDFTDLTFALSAWSRGLPPMFADAYVKYMASDAKTGAKQKAGSSIQLGQRPGQLTARPPQTPPTPDMTGGAGGK